MIGPQQVNEVRMEWDEGDIRAAVIRDLGGGHMYVYAALAGGLVHSGVLEECEGGIYASVAAVRAEFGQESRFYESFTEDAT